MNASIVIATRGDQRWAELARLRAVPSAQRQGALEVLHRHFHANATLAVARNELADEAVGEYLVFLDADDALASGYIAAMRHAEEDSRGHGQRLLVPAMQHVATDGRWVGAAEIPAWGQSLLDVNCACIGTAIPATLFRSVGGFHEEPIFEDWALVLRCVVAGAKLVPVPRAVYLAHENLQGRNRQYGAATYDRVRSKYLPHAGVIDAAKIAQA